MKQHFARYGIPSTVVSDNGPQFSSKKFESFSKNWDFKHEPSDLGYPKGNGKAESAVKTAKALMNKCAQAKTDPYVAILETRNTPTQDVGSSPAQRLLNRRTRSFLPMAESLLAPRGDNYLELERQRLTKNKVRKAENYHKSSKDLQVLKEGDTFRMQPFRLGQKT